MKKGFTMIEIAIVVGIFGLLLGIGLPAGMDAYRNYMLSNETANLATYLRRAQGLSFSNKDKSAHGLSIQNDSFVVFEGQSYASRNSSMDEIYPRSASVSASGTTEIVFAPLSGSPNASATIVLNNNLRSQILTLNEQGALSW